MRKHDADDHISMLWTHAHVNVDVSLTRNNTCLGGGEKGRMKLTQATSLQFKIVEQPNRKENPLLRVPVMVLFC